MAGSYVCVETVNKHVYYILYFEFGLRFVDKIKYMKMKNLGFRTIQYLLLQSSGTFLALFLQMYRCSMECLPLQLV
jgi:hypothetical protein